LVSDGKGEFSQGSIVLGVGEQEVGMAVTLPGCNPDESYAHCIVRNGIENNPPGQEFIPKYPGYDANTSYFLTKRKNITPTLDYYKVVVGMNYRSPNNCGGYPRCTLRGWWMANGWDKNGQNKNEARTVFLNNNDLGYVRDMHCLSPAKESKVACWVTNYSDANQEVTKIKSNFPPLLNAAKLDLDFTLAGQVPPNKMGGAKATVVMEYRIIPGVNNGMPVVTFIAYGDPGGTLGDAKIVEKSDQDGFGGKDVPGMCNNCHGGSSFSGDADVSGQFIVFDLSTFIFPRQGPFVGRQETAFKQQNMVVLSTAPRAAIKELINGWYAGNPPCNDPNKFCDQFLPPGWTKGQVIIGMLTQDKLYFNVVRTCRTCHTALRNGISWRTYAQFKGNSNISAYVCGLDRNGIGIDIMPHDAVSYLNFWRFNPPGNPPRYPRSPINPYPPPPSMQQPFIGMGAFLNANRDVSGACENSKGRSPQE
jgi:hypothetical protein